MKNEKCLFCMVRNAPFSRFRGAWGIFKKQKLKVQKQNPLENSPFCHFHGAWGI